MKDKIYTEEDMYQSYLRGTLTTNSGNILLLTNEFLKWLREFNTKVKLQKI